MIRDETLDLLRRAVLEDPKEDSIRGVYADRLDELSRHDDAAMIRRQLADPTAKLTLSGAEVGLPAATTATYRRGFIEEVRLPGRVMIWLPEILALHPVELALIYDVEVAFLFTHEGPRDKKGKPSVRRPYLPWVASFLVEEPVPFGEGPEFAEFHSWRRKRRKALVAFVCNWATSNIAV